MRSKEGSGTDGGGVSSGTEKQFRGSVRTGADVRDVGFSFDKTLCAARHDTIQKGKRKGKGERGLVLLGDGMHRRQKERGRGETNLPKSHSFRTPVTGSINRLCGLISRWQTPDAWMYPRARNSW